MANKETKILISFICCLVPIFLCGITPPIPIPDLGGNADKPFIDLYGDGGNGSAIDTAIKNGVEVHESFDESENTDQDNDDSEDITPNNEENLDNQTTEDSNDNKELSIEINYMTVRINGVVFADYEDEIVKRCEECEQITLTDWYAETKTYISVLNILKESGKEYIEDEKND